MHMILKKRKSKKPILVISIIILIVLIILFFNFKNPDYANSMENKGVSNSPPSLSVSLNPNNPQLSEPVTITAIAADDLKVSEVIIYVDGMPTTCMDDTCIFETTYNEAGTHSYYSIARDDLGNQVRTPESGELTFTISDSEESGFSSGGGSSGGGSGGGGGSSAGGSPSTESNPMSDSGIVSDGSNYFVGIPKNRAGTGNGRITSSPEGILCAPICGYYFLSGTSVTFTASILEDSTFDGWVEDCAFAGMSTTCTLTITSNKTIDAIFTAPLIPTVSVYVSKTGSGSGTVTSSGDPQLINCGTTCEASFPTGSSITFTGTPDPGSALIGWNSCIGAGTCTITADYTTEVTAVFETIKTLKVQKSGSGLVMSDPTGINCGATCNYGFALGTSILLTATPASKFSSTSWTGCDYVLSGMCYLVLSTDRTVKATFT